MGLMRTAGRSRCTPASGTAPGADSGPRAVSTLHLDPQLAPIRVVEVEFSDPAALWAAGSASRDPVEVTGPVLALARRDGVPIGLVQATVDRPDCALDILVAAARAEFGEDVGPRPPGSAEPVTAGSGSPAVGEPLISVVIATRERPAQLARCLESVARLRYRNHEVIVVDNAPETDAAERLVRERFGHLADYVTEPRRGLAAAHNRGLAAARGEIVAFTDDDVIVDQDWLTAIAAGFAAGLDVGCVTGLIVPAELETAAQVALEAHGRFGKGFEQRRYSIWEPGEDPLFPFTAGRLGSGANMAFSAAILRDLDGFDPATGVGTVARGGDDLLAFFHTIVAGHSLVYEPGAIIWHHHARTAEALERQAHGYGVGLGAFLAAALTNDPHMIPAFLRRIPRGVVHAIADIRSHGGHAAGWTPKLSRAQALGLLYGPIAYLRSRRTVIGTESPS